MVKRDVAMTKLSELRQYQIYQVDPDAINPSFQPVINENSDNIMSRTTNGFENGLASVT